RQESGRRLLAGNVARGAGAAHAVVAGARGLAEAALGILKSRRSPEAGFRAFGAGGSSNLHRRYSRNRADGDARQSPSPDAATWTTGPDRCRLLATHEWRRRQALRKPHAGGLGGVARTQGAGQGAACSGSRALAVESRARKSRQGRTASATFRPARIGVDRAGR